MSTDILIPKVGFAGSEGNLAEWLLDDGATVNEGDPLYSLETDKATQELEAPASGILKILKPAGDTYPVGTVIGQIL